MIFAKKALDRKPQSYKNLLVQSGRFGYLCELVIRNVRISPPKDEGFSGIKAGSVFLENQKKLTTEFRKIFPTESTVRH